MPDKTPNAAFCRRGSSTDPNGAERTLYFFKERQYLRWDLLTEAPVAGFPREIRDDWPGLLDVFPGRRITAALHVPEWGERVFFLFDGEERAAVWDLAAGRLAPETVPLAQLLPGAFAGAGRFTPVVAQTADGTRVIYGFRGEEYTRWTATARGFPAGEDPGYPRRIAADWKDGLVLAPKCGVHAEWPNRSSAHSNNKIYFFMGDLYLRWDVPSNTRNYRTDIYAGWKNWPSFR
jgi:hypothetical protein